MTCRMSDPNVLNLTAARAARRAKAKARANLQANPVVFRPLLLEQGRTPMLVKPSVLGMASRLAERPASGTAALHICGFRGCGQTHPALDCPKRALFQDGAKAA